jgi:hypothetical protein
MVDDARGAHQKVQSKDPVMTSHVPDRWKNCPPRNSVMRLASAVGHVHDDAGRETGVTGCYSFSAD